MAYEALTIEARGAVALVTLQRPEMLNALNQTLRDEIVAVCGEIGARDEFRAAVFTGEGRGFCSGADLTPGTRSVDPDAVPPQNDRLDEYGWVGRQARAVYGLNKPTIAAVNGPAAGAGMSLALACDLRVGSERTMFKTTFVERSLSPDSGMSFFLPRIIGYGRAADLIFTSRRVDGDEAYRLGLLDRLVSHESLVETALELGEQIAKWPPLAMRSAKRTIQWNMQVDLDAALRNEASGLRFAGMAPKDRQESLASFREQREPHFTGE